MDWTPIKTEYITTDISLRKLAQKYDVSTSSIFKRSQEEKWPEARMQARSNGVAAATKEYEGEYAKRARRLGKVADKLLGKVEKLLDGDFPFPSAAYKDISATLKNIKEIQMIRSERDLAEQDARIASLNRQAASANKSENDITVAFENEADASWKE